MLPLRLMAKLYYASSSGCFIILHIIDIIFSISIPPAGTLVAQAEHSQVVKLLCVLDEIVDSCCHGAEDLLRVLVGVFIQHCQNVVNAEHAFFGIGCLGQAVRIEEDR